MIAMTVVVVRRRRMVWWVWKHASARAGIQLTRVSHC